MVIKSILIILVLGGAYTFADGPIGEALRMPGVAAAIREAPGAVGVLILFAAVLLVSALMLLAGRRTGWLLAMVITGIFVAIDIVAFLAGTGSQLWMLLNVVTVFYLNQRDVRELVGVTLERGGRGAAAGRVMTDATTVAADAPGDVRAEDDLELLRQYEPILRFTHGEMFFPMPAERYLEAARPARRATAQELRVVVPSGELDEARLVAEGETDAAAIRFLRFVQAPMNPIELARFNQRPDRDSFEAPGRLARVGILARILDAALVASLLVSGKVPGGTRRPRRSSTTARGRVDPRVSYHGRVVAARRLGRPPVPVLLRDERLALDVRRAPTTTRPTGSRRSSSSRTARRRRRGRSGSRRPRTTSTARTSAAAGTTRGSRSDGDHVIVYPGSRLARDVHGARRIHHAAAAALASGSCTACSTSSAGSGGTRSTSRTRATSPRRSRASCRCRSSTTRAATG